MNDVIDDWLTHYCDVPNFKAVGLLGKESCDVTTVWAVWIPLPPPAIDSSCGKLLARIDAIEIFSLW